ncbi:MAG: DUF362 domain-containing protein [Desulfobacterales bacterium]|jgi:uncharacterized protein (DUF362 family)|nr:DUF362 domain-containing protein [Desulfobacteraceae bacterium]MBT4365488.1 DUF362 domain-containing protein [Desulfobacteraceae bacterium]MBT7696820.1 DUF362 domain-containing protein [Desulfobacterales bacterium]
MNSNRLSKSPFKSLSSHPEVFISGGEGPYINTINVLSNLDLSPARGLKVLLKPNVGRIAPTGEGITTNPLVVAAAIDAFVAAGAEVAVGESPIVGVKTFEAFDAAGITKIANERNCKLIDLDAGSFIKVPVPDGHVIDSIKVCPEVLEYDLVVSIPVIKMHMHTGVSISIKNMKGCLWRRSKVELHMLPPVEGNEIRSIDIAITDMSGILRPHLSIIDGTVGMEGLGPSAGSPKALDIIAAGIDPFATDSVVCRLIGTRAEDIPHLSLGAKRGYGEIDINNISITPEDWKKYIIPFTPPPKNLTIEFPNIKVLDNNSCSACQSTVLLFLRRYRDKIFDYLPSDSLVNIAIGKGHENLPDKTICIGNCTAKHRNAGIFVHGCPPVGSAILQAISGKPSIDVMDGHSKTPDVE